MKKIFSRIILLSIFITNAYAKEPCILITVSNPLNLNRTGEMIVIRWHELKEILPAIDAAKIFVHNYNDNKALVTQSVDLDQNGVPEEIVFLSDFNAMETKKFIIEILQEQDQKAIQPITGVHYMLPRQDVAWENDRIAFRIYGPAFANELNNGIDVWVKRVRYPIIEKWYKGDEADSLHRIPYHEDHGEGADFFNVGKSLGAGGCALYKDDSLYQPGVFENYKIIAAGPIRSIFEVTYKPVRYNERYISEMVRITLDAGSPLNRIEVTFKCDSLTGSLPFAAGIVKRNGVTGYKDKQNKWVSLWGQINEKEENGFLGTGIVASKEIKSVIKENNTHLLMLGTAGTSKPAVYYAGASWTRSGDFNTVEAWNKYLKEFSERLDSHLKIKMTIAKD